MDKKELMSLMSYVSGQLRDGLPEGGTSTMITSDGEGGVYCHLMGKRCNILTAMCVTLDQNEQLFEIMQAAVKAVELKKDIKKDLDGIFGDFLESLSKAGRNDSKKPSSDDEAEVEANKADTNTDENE